MISLAAFFHAAPPSTHRSRLWPAAALVIALLAVPASAQEEFEEIRDPRPAASPLPLPPAVDLGLPPAPPAPSPRPTPAPQTIDAGLPPSSRSWPSNEPLVRFHSWAGRQHSFSGAGFDNRWAAGVAVRGPVLGLGRLDVLVGLDIGGMPESGPVDLTRAETWGRAAELRLGLLFPVLRKLQGGQDVRLELEGSWGFWTALEAQPLTRYLRAWGFGFRLAESKSGAFLSLLAGRYGPGGPSSLPQLMLAGSFPLVRFGDVVSVSLVGDGGLTLGAHGPENRDVLRLAVAVAR